jgi:cobalt-zinc-cadmium efflux system outer membrane protein
VNRLRIAIAALLAAASLTAHAQAVAWSALTLADAERVAGERNRDIVAARRAVEVARADALSAGARPNPQLSVNTTNINPSSGIGAGGLWSKYVDTVFRVDQLIERGSKRELRMAQAEKLAEASQAGAVEAVRSQRFVVAAAYYDLKLAQERTGIAQENVDLFARILEASDRRLRAGDIAPADVSRIRVDALRAENEARTAQAELARARITLAFLLAAEQEAAALRAVDAWPEDAETPAVDDGTIDRRPDVRAARARVEAAERGRELARSLRTRDVTVGMQFEHYPINPEGANGTGSGSGNSFGVGISIPLFLRYQYQGEIARAEAELAGAEEGLERARAVAQSELAQAASDLRAARERRMRQESTLLPEAKRSADYAAYAYRNGAIGVLELLDAQRTLAALQFEAATARADYAKALAAWRAAALQ